MICESYMNLRSAPGIDDYILQTRTTEQSRVIKQILQPHPALVKQSESYNLHDVNFLLRHSGAQEKPDRAELARADHTDKAGVLVP